MGVRKAQDPPTAIAIRKGSIDAPKPWAKLMPTGAISTTVAALLMMSERNMVITRIKAITPQKGSLSPKTEICPAIKSAPPDVSMASPTGIIAPRRTITGQSTLAYISLTGSIPDKTMATAAMAKATCTGKSPVTTRTMDVKKMARLKLIFF